MSHQVQIDYQSIAIQCESICEVAERRLAELDEILVKAKEASSSLMKDRAAVLAQDIEREKKELIQQIDTLKERAVIVGKRGMVYVDFDAVAKKIGQKKTLFWQPTHYAKLRTSLLQKD